MDSDTIRNDGGMSKQQHALLIQPAYNLALDCMADDLIMQSQGNGWFWGVDDYGERIKQDCPVCKGNKRLKAVVTIAWQPDETGKNR